MNRQIKKHLEDVRQATIPSEQVWFWTEMHQRKEKAADEDLKAGRYKDFKSAKDLIRDLRRGAARKKK